MLTRGRTELDFDELASTLTPRMFRTALLLCADWHLAEDLVQTTWANLYASWARVEASDNPVAYAHGALVKAHLSHRRARLNLERPTDLSINSESADPDVATRLALLAALASLERLDRTIVVLRYWEDRSVAETAAAVGLRPGAIKTRCHRALKVLRRQLATIEEGTT